MGKTCFVPNCTSGYRSNELKVSLFKPPSESALLEKWRNAIPRKDKVLTEKTFVCEKHFCTDEIVKEWCAKTQDGYTIMKGKRRPALIPNAIPTIFPDCPTKHLTKVIKKRKLPALRKAGSPSKTSASACVSTSLEANRSDCCVLEQTTSVETCETLAHSQASNSTDTYSSRFDFDKFKDDCLKHVVLPPMWNVSVTDFEGFQMISFYQTQAVKQYSTLQIVKQLCFVNDSRSGLVTGAYILNCPVSIMENMTQVLGIKDVQSLLNLLDEKSVCCGGPKITELNNVLPETSYKDTGKLEA